MTTSWSQKIRVKRHSTYNMYTVPRIVLVCLTMSKELMKSKFVRRPSGCGIDYLRTCRMDFCQILFFACPGPYFRTVFLFVSLFFLMFVKKKAFSDCLRYFVNMGPYGSKDVKTLLLPQITFESSEFSSQMPARNYCFEFWNFEFLILTIFLIYHGTPGKPITLIIWTQSDRRAKRSEI